MNRLHTQIITKKTENAKNFKNHMKVASGFSIELRIMRMVINIQSTTEKIITWFTIVERRIEWIKKFH